MPAGETQASFLRRLAQVGARDRYRPYHDRARAQIARELDLIEKLDLAGYFLIVWDLVNFCRQQGILVQGRGSAANSAVCYALGITAVDPVGMDLLFERFLSEERGEWPDIDLDLPSGDRRERVIQYVYERYGTARRGDDRQRHHLSRPQRRARSGQGARASTPDEIDRLARHDGPVRVRRSGRDVRAPPARGGARSGDDGAVPAVRASCGARCRICRGISASTPAAWCCARAGSTRSCRSRTPRCPGASSCSGTRTTAPTSASIKVDLLGLGMMAALEDAIAIINAPDAADDGDRRGRRTSNVDAGSGAPAARRSRRSIACCSGPTRSACSRWSRARRWRRCRGCSPSTSTISSSRWRSSVPGPLSATWCIRIWRAGAGEQPVTYAHPLLEPVLTRTLGVPLFQEQLLRMAMVVAGFSGGEAEELRRAMGFKRSVKRMQQIETRLREGMARNGIAGAAADQIVQSITSFALYGFPESHAASFALIVYASAYLKAHYPGGVLYGAAQQPADGVLSPGHARQGRAAARRAVRAGGRAGVGLGLPGEPDGAIRLGLRYVRGVREEAGRQIEKASRRHGAARSRMRPVDGLRSIEELVAARRAAAGRSAGAGRGRRAGVVRRGPPHGALAGRTGRPAGRPAPRGCRRDSEPMQERRPRPAPAVSPAADDAGRARAGRLRRHGADDRAASDGARPRVAGDARRRARDRPAARTRRPARPRGRGGDHAPAPGHRERVRLPVAGRRNRHRQHHRHTRFFAAYKRTIVDEPYLLVEGIAAESERRRVGEGGSGAGACKDVGPEVESHDFH